MSQVQMTLGPILAGGLVAVALSAVVGIQTVLYFRFFPHDPPRYKVLVSWVWFIDAVHTIIVCCAIWEYAIIDFNHPERLLVMPWGWLFNIPFTLVATLNATLFYTWRIAKLSKRNWFIVIPMLSLIMSRFVIGWVDFRLEYEKKHWGAFRLPVLRIAAWTISAMTDIVIAVGRYYYLRELKQGYLSLLADSMDAVVVFTINDGLLSCVVVLAATGCILALPQYEIWVGFYFTFAKLFANSVLATLNMRTWFRNSERPMGIKLNRTNLANRRTAIPTTISTPTTAEKVRPQSSMEGLDSMQIFVDRQVDVVDKVPAAQEFNITVGHYVREPPAGMISPISDPESDNVTSL